MAQLSPPRSDDADWALVLTGPREAHPSRFGHFWANAVWLRWLCAVAVCALLAWLGIAAWAAEGDAGCTPATHVD